MAQSELFKLKQLVETKTAPSVTTLQGLTDGVFIDFGKAAFGTIEF